MENVNYCQCGCGEQIMPKPYHRYYGVPKYIMGHSSRVEANKKQSKVPDVDLTQVLYCKCGCGELITLKKSHKWDGIPEYVSGHNSRTQEGRDHARTLMENKQPWNKGKTKETDERLMIIAQKVSKTLKGREVTEEWRKNLSIAGKGKPKSEKHRNNISKGHIGIKNTPETRRKISKSLRGRERSKEVCEAMSIRMKGNIPWNAGLTLSEDHKNKIKAYNLEKWKDVEFKERVVRKWRKSCTNQPNKLEVAFQEVMDKVFPNEWKFVGDGEVIIAGKCPDFININGKSLLIELFGDYWHKGDIPEDRVAVFKPHGYDTLVIWESEFKKSQATVITKVAEFMQQGDYNGK